MDFQTFFLNIIILIIFGQKQMAKLEPMLSDSYIWEKLESSINIRCSHSFFDRISNTKTDSTLFLATIEIVRNFQGLSPNGNE